MDVISQKCEEYVFEMTERENRLSETKKLQRVWHFLIDGIFRGARTFCNYLDE